jgi:cytochrome d ubiquinol oxidase subunit II
MLLLSGLIFRAVAIEFRSKHPSSIWRWVWDVLFSFASLCIAMGLGIVVGNLVRGIPLDQEGEFIGTFFSLLNPYALLVSLFTAALFAMHGGIYILMKTEDELHDKLRSWINPLIITFIMLYAITSYATLIYQPHMIETIRDRPVIFIVALVNMFAIANIPREIAKGKDGFAFLSSCLNIICLLALSGIGTYPNVVRALNDPEHSSLTIYNAASSLKTLEILLLIAIIGVPLVISYTIAVYWIFRGKVRLESSSY